MSRRREPERIRNRIREFRIGCVVGNCGRRADYFQRIGAGGVYWCREHAPADIKTKKGA